MMRVILVEDEKPALAQLEKAVQRFDPDIEILATFGSVRETVKWLTLNDQPDLMICDIQLSDGLSMHIFEQVTVTCPVIFCTAYDEYLLQAFSCSGIDYLLKPIDQARLDQALNKYLRLRSHFAGRLDTLTETLVVPPSGYRQRVMVKKGIDFLSIPVEDIAYFTTEHKMVLLVTRANAQYLVDRTIGELADELDPRQFFRVNRQFLVHYSSIRKFRPHLKGRITLILEPPAQDVVVSQENARRFREWMDR